MLWNGINLCILWCCILRCPEMKWKHPDGEIYMHTMPNTLWFESPVDELMSWHKANDISISTLLKPFCWCFVLCAVLGMRFNFIDVRPTWNFFSLLNSLACLTYRLYLFHSRLCSHHSPTESISHKFQWLLYTHFLCSWYTHPFLCALVALYLFQSILLRLSDGAHLNFYLAIFVCLLLYWFVSLVIHVLFRLSVSKLGERPTSRWKFNEFGSLIISLMHFLSKTNGVA